MVFCESEAQAKLPSVLAGNFTSSSSSSSSSAPLAEPLFGSLVAFSSHTMPCPPMPTPTTANLADTRDISPTQAAPWFPPDIEPTTSPSRSPWAISPLSLPPRQNTPCPSTTPPHLVLTYAVIHDSNRHIDYLLTPCLASSENWPSGWERKDHTRHSRRRD